MEDQKDTTKPNDVTVYVDSNRIPATVEDKRMAVFLDKVSNPVLRVGGGAAVIGAIAAFDPVEAAVVTGKLLSPGTVSTTKMMATLMKNPPTRSRSPVR